MTVKRNYYQLNAISMRNYPRYNYAVICFADFAKRRGERSISI